MQAVVTSFFPAFEHIVVPGIHPGLRRVGIHLKIAFFEEFLIVRMQPVVPPFFPAFEYIMAPGIHS